MLMHQPIHVSPDRSVLDTKPFQTPRGMIVVLNSFPGAGKHTVLKQAQALLPGTRLLDNHLLIDPVTALIPTRNDAHHELRRQIRAPVFRHTRRMAQEGNVILMTACLTKDNEQDAAVLQEHLELVRNTDVPLLWLNADCDIAELEQRVCSPERCNGSKTKLTDVALLRKLVRENHLIDPRETLDEGTIRLFVETMDMNASAEVSVDRLMDIIGLSGGVNALPG
ncbi:hypothetical protein C8F04DRAFT_1069173 [Mycena alexandri]|uniref:Chloramphenicol phosphotransferase n=1 Tax=Mycena alexandri TaxID=1745969 RepID=A0AAD6XA07_9AGAR|nr:hypothetical protein C8F04DRAFT_1069173 [Mycena alexandri]